jgi:Pectate lyase superfamily protein
MRFKSWLRFSAAFAFVCLALSARAQYTTVSASYLGGSLSPAPSAMIYWQPTGVARVGTSNGQILGVPLTAPVTNGVFSLSVPDSSSTNPNICYAVTAVDPVGTVLLGAGLASDQIHVNTGGAYSCLQPTGSSWNFDTYLPTSTAVVPPLTGGTVTGPITFNSSVTFSSALGSPLFLPGNPTLALQAAPKQYVDCFKDQANGLFNVACYGAVGDGTTNSTTAFQNAVNAATPVGGTVVIPPQRFAVNSTIQSACDAIVCLPVVSASAPQSVHIQGTTRVRHDAQMTGGSGFSDGSIILTSVNTGTDGKSAIFGVPTVPANMGAINNVELEVDHLTLLTYANPKIGCINAFWASGATIDHVRCWNGEHYYTEGTHTQPTNASYGIILPGVGNDTMVSLTWSEISGFNTGVWASEHAYFNGTWTAYSLTGYEFGQGFYPITGHLGSQENALPVKFTGGLTPGSTGTGNITVQINLGLEIDPSNIAGCTSWCYSTTDIQDTQNSGLGIANGDIFYKTTLAGVGNTSSYPIRLAGATNLNFNDGWSNLHSHRAAGTARASDTFGTLPTTDPDGLYPGVSVQYGAYDMVLGHDNTGSHGGAIQCYTGGSGYTLGTSWGSCALNPYGGPTQIGSANGIATVTQSDLPDSKYSFQHIRVATCSTTTTSLSNCSLGPISWPVAFADANYTVVCTPDGFNVAGATTAYNKAAASIYIGVVNLTSGTAVTSGNIDCIAKHDN